VDSEFWEKLWRLGTYTLTIITGIDKLIDDLTVLVVCMLPQVHIPAVSVKTDVEQMAQDEVLSHSSVCLIAFFSTCNAGFTRLQKEHLYGYSCIVLCLSVWVEPIVIWCGL